LPRPGTCKSPATSARPLRSYLFHYQSLMAMSQRPHSALRARKMPQNIPGGGSKLG
jgi:hypothetical protein